MLHRVLVIHPPAAGTTVQLVGVRLVEAPDSRAATSLVRQAEPDDRTVAYESALAPGEIVSLPHMTMPREEAGQWLREALEVA